MWLATGTSDADLQHRRKLFALGQVVESLSNWRHHYAYIVGNNRLSCSLCILAPAAELARGASYNPIAYKSYRHLEEVSGFSFKQDLSLASLNPKTPEIPGQELADLLLKMRPT